jgi:hypothetical protein
MLLDMHLDTHLDSSHDWTVRCCPAILNSFCRRKRDPSPIGCEAVYGSAVNIDRGSGKRGGGGGDGGGSGDGRTEPSAGWGGGGGNWMECLRWQLAISNYFPCERTDREVEGRGRGRRGPVRLRLFRIAGAINEPIG